MPETYEGSQERAIFVNSAVQIPLEILNGSIDHLQLPLRFLKRLIDEIQLPLEILKYLINGTKIPLRISRLAWTTDVHPRTQRSSARSARTMTTGPCRSTTTGCPVVRRL